MTSITWAGPRCVQELGAFLGSQNRTQRGCELFSAECGAPLKPCRVATENLVLYPTIIPARDSGRWLNQRIIRSTIFKPPQDWQIIIYTSTSKIFWEISAVSSLDLASCGLLVSAGLSGARGKTGIFLFLCGGANINKYGRNIHLFCPGLRHQSSKLIQTPNFPFPHSYITPHTD